MGQAVGETIGSIATAPLNLVTKPLDWVGLDSVGDAPGNIGKAVGGFVGNQIAKDPTAPELPKSAAAPDNGPAPQYASPAETASMRRRKLESLRMGVLSTIKTSAQGVQDSTALTKPVAAAAAAPEATKTKLGQ